MFICMILICNIITLVGCSYFETDAKIPVFVRSHPLLRGRVFQSKPAAQSGSLNALDLGFIPTDGFDFQKRGGELSDGITFSNTDQRVVAKRSFAAKIEHELKEFKSMIRELAEVGTDVSDLVKQYKENLIVIIKLLQPPMTEQKIEEINMILRSFMARRGNAWTGKRSDFYSWGGKRKRDINEEIWYGESGEVEPLVGAS